MAHAQSPRSPSPPSTVAAGGAGAAAGVASSFIVNSNTNTAAAAAATAAATKFAPAPAFTVPASLSRYQIAPAAFLAQHRGAIHQLVAAAVVVWAPPPATITITTTTTTTHDDKGSGIDDNHHHRVLVLQRSRHDYAGLAWEVPGGMCEAGDETILSAACRELWEEAGLRAAAVTDVVEDTHDWIDGGETWRKMTFLVEVGSGEDAAKGAAEEPPVVRLDPNEHEDFAWATEQQVRDDRCEDGRPLQWTTAAQKATILDTFQLLRSKAAAAPAAAGPCAGRL